MWFSGKNNDKELKDTRTIETIGRITKGSGQAGKSAKLSVP